MPIEDTVTGVIAALVQRGREVEENRLRAKREEEERQAQADAEYRAKNLMEALSGLLGLTVERSSITLWRPTQGYPDLNHGRLVASVQVEGYRFAYGYETQDLNRHRHHDAQTLLIERVCSKNCEHPLWVPIYSFYYDEYGREPITQLADAITSPQAHRWGCLVKYNDEGEAITDWDGNPLPPRAPKPRTLTAEEVHDLKTDIYSNLVKFRRELQFDKAIEKEEAITRIMASGVAKSYTAAEKLVETDARYKALCATLTETIKQEIRAKEELLVARAIRTGIGGEKVGGPEDAP